MQAYYQKYLYLFHWFYISSGVGWGTIVYCGTTGFWIILMAWVLNFLYHSFSIVLPWSTCDNYWNTEQCHELQYAVSIHSVTISIIHITISILHIERILGSWVRSPLESLIIFRLSLSDSCTRMF